MQKVFKITKPQVVSRVERDLMSQHNSTSFHFCSTPVFLLLDKIFVQNKVSPFYHSQWTWIASLFIPEFYSAMVGLTYYLNGSLTFNFSLPRNNLNLEINNNICCPGSKSRDTICCDVIIWSFPYRALHFHRHGDAILPTHEADTSFSCQLVSVLGCKPDVLVYCKVTRFTQHQVIREEPIGVL